MRFITSLLLATVVALEVSHVAEAQVYSGGNHYGNPLRILDASVDGIGLRNGSGFGSDCITYISFPRGANNVIFGCFEAEIKQVLQYLSAEGYTTVDVWTYEGSPRGGGGWIIRGNRFSERKRQETIERREAVERAQQQMREEWRRAEQRHREEVERQSAARQERSRTSVQNTDSARNHVRVVVGPNADFQNCQFVYVVNNHKERDIVVTYRVQSEGYGCNYRWNLGPGKSYRVNCFRVVGFPPVSITDAWYYRESTGSEYEYGKLHCN